MNTENIQKAINVMQRVIERDSKFNMGSFQIKKEKQDVYPIKDEEKLHTCDTSACFSGWLAVSPEWKEFGGNIHAFGSANLPIKIAVERNILPCDTKNDNEYYKEITEEGISEGKFLPAHFSLACFLGISARLAYDIIYPPYKNSEGSIYGKVMHEVSPQDVIDVLTKLKNGEVLPLRVR